jgi:hypothetical protein
MLLQNVAELTIDYTMREANRQLGDSRPHTHTHTHTSVIVWEKEGFFFSFKYIFLTATAGAIKQHQLPFCIFFFSPQLAGNNGSILM